jgi:uncharacterized membrane protein YcaP (DUF421 family)
MAASCPLYRSRVIISVTDVEGGALLRSMFSLGVPALEKILRALLIYGFLVVAMRVAGRRTVAQLSTTDFVVLLIVSNTVQNGIIGPDDSVTGGVIGATTLFVADAAVAWVVFRSGWARRLIEGKPTVLIEHGRPLEENLRKEEITHEELLEALRKQGVQDVGQVDEAVLTPAGSVVVTKFSESEEMRAIRRLESKLDALLSR